MRGERALGARRWVLLAVALAAVPVVVGAQTGESFRDQAMIGRVLLKYRSLKTLTQTVTAHWTVGQQGVEIPISGTFTVQMAQPNRFRIEGKMSALGAETSGLTVCDGKTVWEYDAKTKQYSEQPLEAVAKDPDKFADWMMDWLPGEITNLLFLQSAGGLPFGTMQGAEQAIKVRAYPSRLLDGRSVYAIGVDVNEKGTRGRAVVFADTSDLLVRKVRYNLGVDTKGKKKEAAMRVEMSYFYSNIAANPNVPDSAFIFTLPEGAEKVQAVKPIIDRVFP